MNKQQLASKIWAAANKMRSKIEANEYKDYILGFIFYKFLSDKEELFLKKEGMTKEDMKLYLVESEKDTVKYVQQNLGYFISYEHLFSTWLSQDSNFDFSVAVVKDALSAFSRLINKEHEKVFKDIFKTLDTGLSNLGSTDQARTKAISDLLSLIDDIPMDGKQNYDVLGFVYEYLISNFASNAGKKAGEFYTPREVSQLMSEIVAYHLKGKEKIEIYDPTSGSGSLLITIGRSVAKHIKDKNNIKYYAQEYKENTYNLTRMNLVMRGILPDNILVRNGDTLEDDWPYFDESDKIGTYRPLYVDAVVSNPPYSQSWNPKDKDAEPRYKEYGIAPKAKADYAFLLHDLYHIKPDGIMAIVLPHGVLFRGGSEEQIRKNLIENNKIDAIIGLPANIFFGTGIPTIIMILKQTRDNTDVLIVDASKGFMKDGKNNVLRKCDIKKIADTVNNRISIPKYSRVVSKEEIRNNQYNLNIPRYVDSSEKGESFDIYATMYGGIPNKEIDDLNVYWQAFPSLKEELFNSKNGAYSTCDVDDVRSVIEKNNDVVSFVDKYNQAFANFPEYLKNELIDNVLSINIVKEEHDITSAMFERLDGIDLVDKYQAYQLFSDKWDSISQDLEVIQTEGIDSITKVVPNMVVKKKDDKEIEVAEGYKGVILPFELVQEQLLSEKKKEISNFVNDLSNISTTLEEILESISEEDKGDFINEDGTAFIPKEISKLVKSFKGIKIEKDSFEEKIVEANKLMDEEKAIKKQKKAKEEELHSLTRKTIEEMSLEDGLKLLEIKWNKPIVDSISEIPIKLIKELESKVNLLKNKYQNTLIDIENEIEKTTAELNSLFDELVGNDFDMQGLQELKKLLGGE